MQTRVNTGSMIYSPYYPTKPKAFSKFHLYHFERSSQHNDVIVTKQLVRVKEQIFNFLVQKE